MSKVVIRKLLETRLQGAPGYDLPTNWENTGFKPSVGVAWARVNTLHGKPLNPTMGDDFNREPGIFQIALSYPENTGSVDAMAKADALCAWFKRGTVLEEGGVRILIDKAPSVGGVTSDGAWFRATVSVYFVADLNQ
jgi:hypothetical protein